MFKLNPETHLPIYEQIKEMVKNMIISGVLKDDERIPSVRELAMQMAINPNTIQKAYKELESDGYIYSLRSKGYFVSPIGMVKVSKRVEVLLNQLKSDVSELFYLGVDKEKLDSVLDEIYKGGNSCD